MKAPTHKPTISADIDGTAYSILGQTRKALKRSGADDEYIQKYLTEARSGDYNNLIAVTMDYVEIG